MLDEPGAEQFTLVHGSVYWSVNGRVNLRIGHAWIETYGRVWDPVENVYYASEIYYRTSEAVAERRYTRFEAAGMFKDLGHYGPWHDD